MGSDENNFNKPFFLDGVSPKFGAILIGSIADILADGLNASQINVLGAFVASIGDTLSYIAAQMEFNKDLLSANNQDSNNSSDQCSDNTDDSSEESSDSKDNESDENGDCNTADQAGDYYLPDDNSDNDESFSDPNS